MAQQQFYHQCWPQTVKYQDQTLSRNSLQAQIQKMVVFSDQSSLQNIIDIIAHFEKSTAIRRTLDGDRHKVGILTLQVYKIGN